MIKRPVFTEEEIVNAMKISVVNALSQNGPLYFFVKYKGIPVPINLEINNGEVLLEFNKAFPVIIDKLLDFKRDIKTTMKQLLNIGSIPLSIEYDKSTYPDFPGSYTKLVETKKPNKIILQYDNSQYDASEDFVNEEIKMDLLKSDDDITFYILKFIKS